MSAENCEIIFNKIDVSGDGSISKDEMVEFIGELQLLSHHARLQQVTRMWLASSGFWLNCIGILGSIVGVCAMHVDSIAQSPEALLAFFALSSLCYIISSVRARIGS